LYFVPDPCPAPRWIDGKRGLAFDPWTVVSRETAPYESGATRTVLVSAERAWLCGR
jgi:hypothetical protein